MFQAIVLFALLFTSLAQANTWEIVPATGVIPPARTSTTGRIVAVGDIHADEVSLISILRQTNIVDQNIKWIGGDTTLVLMGDLLDRGFNSRRVMDILMRLEGEAAQAGGRVISLLGNHELMVTQGELEYFNTDDAIKNYGAHFSFTRKEWKQDVLRYFHQDSPYASWIGRRPSLVILNRTLFVHAGFEEWLRHADIDDINETVRAWLLYYQQNAKMPPVRTAWTIGQNGPLWTRQLAMGALPIPTFENLLQQLGVDRVVVGHTTVSPGYLLRPNQRYGEKLRMIDSGISKFNFGSLTALEISADDRVTPLLLKDADCASFL